MPQTIRLVSWNIRQGGGRYLPAQIAALAESQPDIVALQEVFSATAAPYQAGLSEIGLTYAIDSFALAPDRSVLVGPRRYGELLASRWSSTTLPPTDFAMPWPERVLSATVASPWGPVEVHTTHVPPGVTNGLIKVETLEGIFTRLAVMTSRLRLLCGDFNTPQEEGPDGSVMTWAQRRNPAEALVFRSPPYGDRWDAAERSVLCGLAAYDLADVYRLVHGYDAKAYSWFWHGRGRAVGRRFDHVFASARLGAQEFRYLHALRDQGFSDHAPAAVVFRPETATAAGRA